MERLNNLLSRSDLDLGQHQSNCDCIVYSPKFILISFSLLNDVLKHARSPRIVNKIRINCYC